MLPDSADWPDSPLRLHVTALIALILQYIYESTGHQSYVVLNKRIDHMKLEKGGKAKWCVL